ncbi:nucleoporin 62 like [Erpetoichthys calabaricus]|uniref:Nuclear pore glycoprotein p62 n=1 Tax=Erpetoichthys calabaricus TaxID=27687 RepID=A0A8C4SJ91_ERPCA|nr:nucleoporin 62 like [Erpetoichthys calabaricus]
MSGFTFTPNNATGGFSFTTPTPKTTTTTATGFNLGANITGGGLGGAFPFGTPSQPQTFGTPSQPQTTSQPSGGLFAFSTPANTGAPSGFTFGASTTVTANPTQDTGGSVSFGASAPKINPSQTTASTGLTLSNSMPSAGTGFSLGGQLSVQVTASSTGGLFTFGNAPPTQQQQPVTSVFSLGTSSSSQPSSGFTFGAPKLPATAAIQAGTAGASPFGSNSTTAIGQTTGLSLGSMAPTPSSTSTSAATSQATVFSFGSKPAGSTAIIPSSSTSTGLSLFGTPATTAPSTAVTGFTFGAQPSSATTATTTTAGLSFLKPAGTSASPSTTTAVVTITGSTPFSLPLKTTGASTIGTLSTTTSAITATTTSAVSTPPVMTYAQLENLINKWSLELEDQERHFLHQATQVNAWDRMLIENGEKITSLHRELEKVKLDQRRLDQELDFILSQQKELEDLLIPLEESVKEQNGTIYVQNADEERERTYKLAENIDAQLKRMSQDLKEIIEHLNTASGPSDSSDPLQQICKILNAHMDSLQWIDQNTVLLQRRAEEVSKLCEGRRKEQEKSMRITFD